MSYLFVPLILLVVAALVWSWWTARADRDPASSVSSFNRALSAMQPGQQAPPTRVGSPDVDDTPARDDSSRDA